MLSKTVFLIIDKMAEVKCRVCVSDDFQRIWEIKTIREELLTEGIGPAFKMNPQQKQLMITDLYHKLWLIYGFPVYWCNCLLISCTRATFSVWRDAWQDECWFKKFEYFAASEVVLTRKKSHLATRNSSILSAEAVRRREHVRNIQQPFLSVLHF